VCGCTFPGGQRVIIRIGPDELAEYIFREVLEFDAQGKVEKL
jgi:hypothetical protein